MAYDPTVFNVDPYYDDYDDNKKFLRILYKPGYAVQARELTQAQTIAQKQVQRFGDHIFKDGSIVTESQVNSVRGKFVRISSLTGYAGVSISDFEGLTGTVSGKNYINIVDALPNLTGSDIEQSSILFFSEYLGGPTAFAPGDVIVSNYDGVQISATVTGGLTYNDYSSAPNILPSTGKALLIGVDQGVRYVKGYFVNHDSQKITIYNVTGNSPNTYRRFDNLNSIVRFDVTNTIITSTDDGSLNDPAFGTYNYAAPGADRYRLDLNLTQNSLGTTAQYSIVTIENDSITYQNNRPDYNVLADELARRTYDESGNYTINDFQVTVDDAVFSLPNGNESEILVNIGPGKAYVYGYEVENPGIKGLTAPKAREYKQLDSLVQCPFVIGNTLNVTVNTSMPSGLFSSIDWNSSPIFYMSTGTTGPFNSAGTLRIGKYEAVENNTKLHVYDVKISSGFSTSNIKRLFYSGYTASNDCIFNLSDGSFNLQNASFSSLLFPFTEDITSYAVRQVLAHEYTIQRSTVANLSSGNTNLSLVDFAESTEFDASTNCEFTSNNDIKVYNSSGQQITVNATKTGLGTTINIIGATGATNAVVFANIDVNELAGAAYVRQKTSVTGSASVSLTSDGFEKFAYLNGLVDVYNVSSVIGEISGVTSDLTEYFDLDNGQRDDIYDWSRIVLKRDYYYFNISNIQVNYARYDRNSSSLPYMVRSYGTPSSLGLAAGGTGVNYKNIPFYTFRNKKGSSVSLSGCLDARPDRITPGAFGATSNPENYGAVGGCHLIAPSFESRWEYYQPRTDKIVLTRDSKFKIIQGRNDDSAPEPTDKESALTIGTVYYNPYTFDSLHAKLNLLKNKRYTMKDIGKLEKRIDRVEYYTTLSLLESEAKSLEIQDTSGLNKFKNGIFVDDFTSRTNSDYNNRDHSSAVDRQLQECRPKFITKYADLSLTGSISSGLTFATRGLAMCNYTTESFINQQKASRFINVNPFNVVNFVGLIQMTPATDDWVDVTVRPDVTINIDNVNDGIADGEVVDFGTVWNNWETTWAGEEIPTGQWMNVPGSQRPGAGRTIQDPRGRRDRNGNIQNIRVATVAVDQVRLALQQQRQVRTGTRISVTPETTQQRIGNRVVDVSIIPYMRAVTIDFKVDNLRPNVRVYPFFDNTSASYFTNVDGVTGAPLITDNAGRLGYNQVCRLNVPAGVYRTGDRPFRLLDDQNNILTNSTTNAETNFRSTGLMRIEEGQIISSRNLAIRREQVSDEQLVDVIQAQRRVNEFVPRPKDPIAQTFFVDPVANPNGIFVKKVDVYFKSKAASLPVTLEVRGVVNGYPSSTLVLPFSTSVLLPSQVNISEDSSVPTTFEFENPVFLLPGELSIVLLSNSNEYEVWISEMGQNDLLTGERITQQPLLGSFFKSQNSTTWTAEQMMDLKFVLHKCKFDTTGGEFTFKYDETNFTTDSSGLTNGANLFRLNTTTILPSSTDVDYTVSFETDGIEIPTENNQNIVFSTKKNINDASVGMITAKTTLSTQSEDVSPIIDLQRVSGLYVQNVLSYFNNMEQQRAYEKLPSLSSITASNVSPFRYLSRKINLQDGFESNEVDVFLSARLPFRSNIDVYMRSQNTYDNRDFRSIPFEKLSVHPDYSTQLNETSQYVSNSEDDYVNLRFIRGATGSTGDVKTSGVTGETEFKNFQIKVVMYGDPNNSIVPAFKDFRVIAT